jgi:hypothetical protein
MVQSSLSNLAKFDTTTTMKETPPQKLTKTSDQNGEGIARGFQT